MNASIKGPLYAFYLLFFFLNQGPLYNCILLLHVSLITHIEHEVSHNYEHPHYFTRFYIKTLMEKCISNYKLHPTCKCHRIGYYRDLKLEQNS